MDIEIKKLKYSSQGCRKKKYFKELGLEIYVLEENKIQLNYIISYEDIDVKFKGEIDKEPVVELFKKINKALKEENPDLCSSYVDHPIVKVEINDKEIKDVSKTIDNLISKFIKVLSRDPRVTKIKNSIFEAYSYK